jgi:GTP-binding protein
MFAKQGTKGEERELILELKMLADVGLVGMPSVGKSSILSRISSARPKIAAYHFTTLSPNLGVVSTGGESGFVAADIPGLIEGAADGLGLGHDFLRHIDRCRLMLHLFDASCEDGENALDKIIKINTELEKWSEELASRPMILVGNKKDCIYDEETLSGVEEFAKEKDIPLFYISAVTGEGLKELLECVANRLNQLPPIVSYESEISFDVTPDRGRETVIEVIDGVYHVTGEWIKRAAGGIYFDDYESFNYFQKILKKGGVFEALVEKGIKEGDTVEIYGLEFNYVE